MGGSHIGEIQIGRISFDLNDYEDASHTTLVIQTKDGILITGRDCFIIGEVWPNNQGIPSKWKFKDGSTSDVFSEPGETIAFIESETYKKFIEHQAKLKKGSLGGMEYLEMARDSTSDLVQVGSKIEPENKSEPEKITAQQAAAKEPEDESDETDGKYSISDYVSKSTCLDASTKNILLEIEKLPKFLSDREIVSYMAQNFDVSDSPWVIEALGNWFINQSEDQQAAIVAYYRALCLRRELYFI